MDSSYIKYKDNITPHPQQNIVRVNLWKRESKEKRGGLFCHDLYPREIKLINRFTTHFSMDGCRNQIKNFNERDGIIYNYTQLKNKYDQLKKRFPPIF
ncbi:hypothetical protein IEQ34_021231 [Dendrobium chrysotoxum]|uniref:Myb/SANT-like domain-containing protein n=1 Tax=Dendrobium chrysotoxum TaxID=161865 RepID=A0AAV7FLY0_DENCH|nr:hypothetical protein IEQ34_021231 [Dendrobium chrysotoxum]